jgi:phosphatidate cytidylyltransferase
VAPFWVKRRWPTNGKWTMLTCGWIVLIGAWVALVELQSRSPWLVLAAMAIVWIADTAAYFCGRAFGRRKLAPQISPGKTWEGVFGGLAAVAVYALCLVSFAREAGFVPAIGALAVAVWLGLALLLTSISVIGDLFESLLKRHAGVKDSGNLLPGHGGVLDRIDALLAAMPLAALAAQLFLVKP